MGNVYRASRNGKQFTGPSAHIDEDADWDTEGDTERASLLEENVRLRALVVKLSELVLRNAVDQHSRPQLVPARRALME